MEKRVFRLLTKENWLWPTVYGLIFAYFLLRYCCLLLPDDTPLDNAQWVHFKQAVTLPLVILLGAVFVHTFSNQIESPSTEGLEEHEKAAVLKKMLQSQSMQRRNWMIFAYSFMLVALLVPIYMFGPGWDGQKNLSITKNNDVHHPVAIFVGCSLDQPKGELSCLSLTQKSGKSQSGGAAPPSSSVPTTQTASAANSAQSAEKLALCDLPGGSWVLNLGGYVVNAQNCRAEEGANTVCKVRGGLLVPIYVIILALVGGSISLTRRLPEYQKCANPEFVSTEKEAKLSQHEFREYLVFQMVQFVSAPFLAILAYFLVDPANSVASVVLAFTAGFASESILLMVRALTEKFTPASIMPSSGTLSGIVTLASAGGQTTPAQNAEISLAASSQVRTLTDDAGFYVLNNVPVGEHGIKVSAKGYEPTTGSAKIERAQEIVRQHWSLNKKP